MCPIGPKYRRLVMRGCVYSCSHLHVTSFPLKNIFSHYVLWLPPHSIVPKITFSIIVYIFPQNQNFMQLWLSLLSVKYFDLENVWAEVCPSSILWFLSTHWFSFSWNKLFIRLTQCVFRQTMIRKWKVSIRELSFVDRSLIIKMM